VSGSRLTTYDPPLVFNANPAAFPTILGPLNSPNPRVQWAITRDKIGFIAINSWTDPAIPTLCQEALEQMRDTRELIIDVRANGGGSETQAKQVAARFEHTNFVYAYYQRRNGTNHTDLTAKMPRTISPHGPWRYDRPVILLIGQKCVSSDESFVGMMTGATNVTTMGDHTCGASGNPEIIQLPFDLAVTVSTWIDYLPDGTPLGMARVSTPDPFYTRS
jgi:C-terminal processing protease CtpA/Prc